MSVNQNVPTCVASGNNNGCRPNPNFGNDSQYSLAGRFALRRAARLLCAAARRAGEVIASPTRIRKRWTTWASFSSARPIDNFNIWQDYGRSDDDQRHRLVFDGTIHSSMAKASTPWQRISHGFQLSGMLQYYSALPFNITTGSNTIQGTAARPTVNGVFINRNAGTGFDFFNVNARLSRTFRIGRTPAAGRHGGSIQLCSITSTA